MSVGYKLHDVGGGEGGGVGEECLFIVTSAHVDRHTHLTTFNNGPHNAHIPDSALQAHLHTHDAVIMGKDGAVAVSKVKTPYLYVLVRRASHKQCVVLQEGRGGVEGKGGEGRGGEELNILTSSPYPPCVSHYCAIVEDWGWTQD